MRTSETRKTEQEIVNIYYLSQKKDDPAASKARIIVMTILEYFRIISVFDGEDHQKIISKLYFSKDNVITAGIRKTALSLFLEEKTLYNYRKKYCEVIKRAIELIYKNNNFTKKDIAC